MNSYNIFRENSRLLLFEAKKLVYICLMQKKRFIAQILLGVALLFTTLFQLFHSYEHFVAAGAYEHEHSSHRHYTESRHDFSGHVEWKEDHGFLDKCFECDFILTSYLLPDTIAFVVSLPFYFEDVFLFTSQNIVPVSAYTFSLRGPPFYV